VDDRYNMRASLMAYRIILLLVAAMVAFTAALPAQAGSTKWRREELSDEEIRARYGGQEDEITLSEALRYLLYLVNRDRRAAGLRAVDTDRTAARAAEEHATEMAQQRYLSHLNLAGEKPTQRYNRYGGVNFVSENVSFWETRTRVYLTAKVVESVHERWMESEPHRQTIMNPYFTHVGMAIVVQWDGDSTVVTAAQEFVAAYGDFGRLPAEAYAGEKLMLTGEFSDRSMHLVQVAVGWEPFPERQRPEELNANLNGYSLPQPFVALMPKADEYKRKMLGVPNLYLITDQPQWGRFRARMSVDDIYYGLKQAGRTAEFKPGLYYFTVWASPEGGKPFIVSAQVVAVDG